MDMSPRGGDPSSERLEPPGRPEPSGAVIVAARSFSPLSMHSAGPAGGQDRGRGRGVGADHDDRMLTTSIIEVDHRSSDLRLDMVEVEVASGTWGYQKRKFAGDSLRVAWMPTDAEKLNEINAKYIIAHNVRMPFRSSVFVGISFRPQVFGRSDLLGDTRRHTCRGQAGYFYFPTCPRIPDSRRG